MGVRFSETVEVVTEKEKEDVDSDSDSDSSSSDFHEIVTSSSDAETVASSDEDDALLLELALGSAYGCDPSLFKKSSMNHLIGAHFCFLIKTSLMITVQ